jgi:hypothetical protein
MALEVVLCSHYPSIKLEVIDTSIAKGVSDAKLEKLEDEVEESVVKLDEDLDLFGEKEQNNNAN